MLDEGARRSRVLIGRDPSAEHLILVRSFLDQAPQEGRPDHYDLARWGCVPSCRPGASPTTWQPGAALNATVRVLSGSTPGLRHVGSP